MKPIISDIRKLFPPRKPNTHKGDYGRIFVLAGSVGMSGAALLSAEAALRSGAGLVTVGIPRSLALPLSKRVTEVMLKPLPETQTGSFNRKAESPIFRFLQSQDVLALGPGLSQHPETQTLVRHVAARSTKPMIIDADGLNAFRGHVQDFLKMKAPVILTPHPGEFVRLFAATKLGKPRHELWRGGKIPKSKADRLKQAREVAKKYKVVLVLKGHETIVAEPGGRFYVNPTGNPGMATGGSGDVLTGMIVALLGQGLKPFDAAKAGVYIHGLAGDLAAKTKGEISLIAGDLIAFLPQAFRKVLGR